MKKLLILMGCFTAIILTTSCTTESIEENEFNIVNDDLNVPVPDPTTEHGGKTKDKDPDDN